MFNCNLMRNKENNIEITTVDLFGITSLHPGKA
jgi:hypothetical protein